MLAKGFKVQKRRPRVQPPERTIHEMRKRRRNLLLRVNYSTVFSAVVLPLAAIAYCVHTSTSPSTSTLWLAAAYYNLTMLAFTLGYHKCYAHQTFRPTRPLHVFFCVFGASVGVGPIRLWAALHRAHHQYTDDPEKDPYSIRRGFLWAHWGWLLKRPKTGFHGGFVEQEFPSQGHKDTEREAGLALGDANAARASGIETPRDISTGTGTIEEDLGPIHNGVSEDASGIADGLAGYADGVGEGLGEGLGDGLADRLGDGQGDWLGDVGARPGRGRGNLAWVLWQEPLYWLFFIASSLVLPACAAVVCGDTWVHGVVFPGVLRMFACQQLVFAAESVCHSRLLVTVPSQPFSDKNTLSNCLNPLVAVLTYGNAQQNYHHEFPHDYRGSQLVWAFDPAKWFLWLLARVRMVSDLATTPKNLVTQLRIQQQQQVLNRMRSQLDWGTPLSKLPRVTTREFRRLSASATDRLYIVIQGIIHDITPFMDQHPGGLPLLMALHGKDATRAFYGGVYGHLTAAVNLLATMRIGVLDVNDEDVWRRSVREEGGVNEERRGGQSRSAEAA